MLASARSGLSGIPGGSAGFSRNRDDAVGRVHMHDAKSGRFFPRNRRATDRHIRSLRDVLAQHQLVIHFVDVVARQNDEIFGRIAADDLDVLEHRVRGPAIPHLLRDALARRQNIETLVAFGAKEIPAALQMANQAVRLVLRGNRDMANT